MNFIQRHIKMMREMALAEQKRKQELRDQKRALNNGVVEYNIYAHHPVKESKAMTCYSYQGATMAQRDFEMQGYSVMMTTTDA